MLLTICFLSSLFLVNVAQIPIRPPYGFGYNVNPYNPNLKNFQNSLLPVKDITTRNADDSPPEEISKKAQDETPQAKVEDDKQGKKEADKKKEPQPPPYPQPWQVNPYAYPYPPYYPPYPYPPYRSYQPPPFRYY